MHPLLARGERLALYLALGYSAPYLGSASPLAVQALTLAVLIGAGSLVYFAVAFGIGGADLGMIRRNIKRGSAQADQPDTLSSE